MRVEKFKVINYIRELLILIDKELENFPKKNIELKNRIKINSFDILEIAYEANSIQNLKNKKELLQKLFAKIKVIDFLLNLCYEKQLITEKKYYKFANKIDDILKYSTGWLKYIITNEKDL